MSTFSRLARNAAALMASGVLDRAATLAFYAVIARALGADVYGQVSLGLTVVHAFQVVNTIAMRNSITRQIAQHVRPAEKTVGAALLVVLAMSALSILALNSLTPWLGYDASTLRVILLLSLLIAPSALGAVFEGVLHGREGMQFIALATAPMQVLRIGGSFLLLSLGVGIDVVILLQVACYAGIALIEAAICFRKYVRFGDVARALDPRLALLVGRGSLGFVGIEFIVAISNAAQYVLIEKVVGLAQLGILNAATQVISLFAMLRIPVTTGSLPVLAQQVLAGGGAARSTALHLIRLLLLVMLPSAVGLVFFGAQAFEILQGDAAFVAGVPMLQLLVIQLVGMTLTGVFGQVIVAARQERWVVVSVILYGAVTIGVSALLLPVYGAFGAAVGMIAGHLVDVMLHCVLAQRALNGYNLWPALWPSMLATAVMTAIIVATQRSGVPPYPAIALAIAAYAAAAGVILYRSDEALRAFVRRASTRLQA